MVLASPHGTNVNVREIDFGFWLDLKTYN
jgi:hypothetical protein